MTLRRWRRHLHLTAALAALVAAGALSAQETGSIAGRVTDRQGQQPVPEAQIFVIGTNLGARTDAEGRYTIRGVPAGSHNVRVLRIGYQQQTREVVVAGGQPAALDFALDQSAVMLQEIVTTVTGPQARQEIGNAIATIQASEVTKSAPVASIADVLNSRAAGVVVTTGGQAGSGSRIRIRGSSSLNLSNDPIYVIDGVRMTSNSNSSSLFTGGAQPSRVVDLNPEEIENIEIVKGPSAATLYGTDAANGVIVITTKKGRSGPASWNLWGEVGRIEDRNDYPTNYTIAGHRPTDAPGTYRQCTLPQISLGTCLLDSVRTYNLFEDSDASPIGTGNRHQYGASVAGGNQGIQYFLSGEREEEIGVLELPPFERRRFAEQNLPLREWVDRPNVYEKMSFRANLTAAVTPKLDLNISSGYINVDSRFTTESNATVGVGSQAFGGPGFKENGVVGGGLGTPLNGYRAWTPGYTWQEKNAQALNRFIGSANANWRPLTWLTTNATVGLDFTDRVDDNLLFRGEGPPINSTYRNGFKFNVRTDMSNFTSNLSSTATWQPRTWLNSSTTVGVQYNNYQFEQNQAGGEDLPPGTQTPNSAAEPDPEEASTYSKTLGLFIEEQLAFNDRLFLTGALRSDQNSAFGTDFQNVVYPKASLSWIVTEEPFFPRPSWMDQFRLRAAYGASGRQPGPNDAVRQFASATTNVGAVDVPAVLFSEVGNSNLRPERTTEFETGFELQMLGGRASIDLTYYTKRTKDALIEAILAPSAGAADEVNRNLGSVRNRGWELFLTTRLIDQSWLGWDLSVNGSTNANKLISLGDTPPQIGTTIRTVEGYPLFGFWGQKITGWDDKNGDGILTYNADPALNEVFVDSEFSFIGYNQPRHILALTNGIELFNRQLRISSLFDYRGGHHWYNNTERIRCISRQNCNGLMNPEASLEEQAMVVASRDHPARSIAGYIQEADYVRFRELAVTYTLPSSVAARIGRARSLSVNFAARNLAVWTDYRGIDPEIDRSAGVSNDTPDEFQTLGPPTYFIFRINAGF